MEDAHVASLDVFPGTSCFGVFDGHGGAEVSRFVAKHILVELLSVPAFQQGDYPAALTETYLSLDRAMQSKQGMKELFKLQRGLPEDYEVPENSLVPGMFIAGSTAVLTVISGHQLFVANVGDSRCILAVAGTALEMSVDHKPELCLEAQRVYAAGGNIVHGRVNGNLNLTRSLGDFEYKPHNAPLDKCVISGVPEVQHRELTAECDFLVVACDGIWEIFSSQACVDFIYERLNTHSLEELAKELCDQCLANSPSGNLGKGCDNMSVILVKLK